MHPAPACRFDRPVAPARTGWLDFGSPSQRAGTIGPGFYNCQLELFRKGPFNMRNWQRWTSRLIGASLIAWAACAAADESVRENRTISQPFNEVHLVGAFDLELIQADTVSLVIEAARDDLATIRSDVSDGVLTLQQTDSGALDFSRWFGRHPAPRAVLSTKALDRLVVEGSGDIHAGTWSADGLNVRVSGSGDVKFDHLTALRSSCEIAGSGDILLAGSVTRQSIRISGSGDYRAPDLKSQTASVSINGSGDVELWVERTLEARIAGSGGVRYYGTPAVTQSVSGSGSLKALGAKTAP
jgi:hypothetical protein